MNAKEIRDLVIREINKHLGGRHSNILSADARDSTGRYINKIGRGKDKETIREIQSLISAEKKPAPYSARFDRDRCRIIDSKTIQLQMTPPESTGYERFVISRGRKLVDNDQSEQLEVQEITTGIGNAVPWSASTSVTHDKTICHPTSPTGKYYRCVTSGTTGTSEPTWSDTGTITDGTAEWELQDNQPVIGNLYITENSGGNPSCGASNGLLRIIKAGRVGSGQDWDYNWGDATGTNKSGRFLLYSESGKPWKQFRIGGDSANGITARIVDIVWDEWSDGGYNYAVADTIIVSRPLLELPYPIHYMIDTGTVYSYYAPYDVNRYIIQDNGDIYTELVLSASAAARSDNGSFVYKSSSALSLPGIGDTLTFNTKTAYGQDDSVAVLNRIAPLKTDKGIAAVVEFYSSKAGTYTGTYYACRRYYLYEWGNNPATFATARELRIPGYETDWHGTAAWDNVNSSLEQVVSDGNDYGVLVQLHKTDSSTPLYFRKLFVSENGADFTEQMSDSGTSDPTEKAFCIGFHQDYFNTLTYARVKHLAIAYGDYTGSTVTVNSVTFGGLLYSATLAGAIANGAGVKLALSYDKPDNANSVADEDNIAYCNILSCGLGMVYYALTPETFLFGPYTFDFSSDLPSGYGTSGFRQDVCYLDGTEMYQPYQYGTKNAVMRSVLTIVEDTTIGDYSNSTITYTALQICTDNDFSGGRLMPLVGERGVCVIEPSITGTTFDGDTGQRIFVFRYNPGSGSGELGRVDGTVFRYSAEYNLLSDGYVLYGLNSELEKKQLDRISVADLTNITTTGASGGMQLVPTATDGNLAKFVSGQVQDSGIGATEVRAHIDHHTHEFIDLSDTPSSLTKRKIIAVDTAGANIVCPDVLGYEPSTRTLTLSNSDSRAANQAAIDSLGRFIPYGVEITVQFSDGTYTDHYYNFTGFYGGGTLRVYGNSGDTSGSTKNVIFDMSGTSGDVLHFLNCSCLIKAKYLDAYAKTSASNSKPFYFQNCIGGIEIYYNVGRGNSTAHGVCFNFNGVPNAYMYNNYVGNATYGVRAITSKITSDTTQDLSTICKVGLAIQAPAEIGKTGTQPTGSVSNESVTGSALR